MNFSEDFIQYVKEWEGRINAFIELKPEHRDASSSNDAALIANVPFAVKDNIAVKDFLFTSGSKLMEQLRSPYTATAVKKLEQTGDIMIGKTNLDEFGIGCSTENSAIKKTFNPWDTLKPADGAAAAVAAGIVPYALGIDTSGTVRQPAAFCGIAGLKPTYGAVSRYGIAARASSFDTAGILADTIARCRAVFSVIRGKDPMDQTSHDAPNAAPPLLNAANGSKKIGVLTPEAISEIMKKAAKDSGNKEMEAAVQAAAPEAEVCRAFELAKERLTALGHSLVNIEIPGLQYSVPAFYTIASAEFSSNLTRLDGIRFGARPAGAENPDELIDKARNAGFGQEVKLRTLLGAFVLRSSYQERYYVQAQKIREGIKRNFEAVLGDSEYKQQAKLDAILMPVAPSRTLNPSAFAQKIADIYICCANLAGLPALAFPVSVEGGLPIGVQLVGRAWAEGTLFDIAESYERQHPFPHPAGYKAFWS
ncbi:MAG: Asp-tRNA(Asn)/Glu-tRNA(Gln) amidotransferase subunit GatA [Treponema sp.]|jgi:aspartyl-tRNA(Asn)/glutamyl-tRNA(Gln) amidotransferase subunit A|nr:Asp-tRNA(Asn)/Glu-tRNA(Gln) amidotransferase subunit GatA [Treponema sp.]